MQQLTSIDFSSGNNVKTDFSMYKDLGISDVLMNVEGQIDTTGATAEDVDNPYSIFEKIEFTFDGSKTPFDVLGEDVRWLHRLYNGVEPEVLVGGALQRNYTDTTNDQSVKFGLKLPVFIPANLFGRGIFNIKWNAAANLGTLLTIDDFDVYPTLVWDDSIPFMLNHAREDQTWSGDKEFKPPFSETLRHILIRVADYSDVLTNIKLTKQRTTLIESRYEELLSQMSDLDNLNQYPLLGDNSTLRYGLLNVSPPAGIVADETTILKVTTNSSKNVFVNWINAIPVTAKDQPESKADLMKLLKI